VTKFKGQEWRFGSEARKAPVHRDAKVFPGAGSYSIPTKLQEGPKYGMGIKLNDSISSSPARNPGPGQYDLQNVDNIKMLKASKYSIGTSSRG
jgi:hypothetical protein